MIVDLLAMLALAATPVAPATAIPSAPPEPRVATGIASWYKYFQGQGAAGPALRAALGPGWRGQTVLVGSRPIRLTDWCQCYEGRPDERLIDLDPRDHPSPGLGLVRVIVTLP